MRYLFILLVFGLSNPNTEVPVDLIELNHISNDTSQFDQFIFWKEYPAVGLNRSEFRAVGFLVLDREANINIIRKNKFCKVGGIKVGSSNVYIVAPLFRESWSKKDPERESARKHWAGNPPNILQRKTENEEIEADE